MKKIYLLTVLFFLLIGYFELDFQTFSDLYYSIVSPDREESLTQTSKGTILLANKSVSIGDDLNSVIETFGESQDTLVSEYGFLWYIYHNKYKDYIQIGIQDDKVVGIYTNAPTFDINGIKTGTSVDDVQTTFGTPLDIIQKGRKLMKQNSIIDGKHEMDVFLYRNMYITFFYDVMENNTVTSVSIIEKETELSLATVYAAGSQDLKYSFEKQNFYAVNALRVRKGLSAFTWSSPIASVAEKHSKDMADNNFFDHVNLKGQSIADRAKASGIRASAVAENIASGAQNSIVMHELLMNSQGHRVNLLNDYQYLGVGVWFNEDNLPYLTQNFYNPPR